jgi:hypothetical protein
MSSQILAAPRRERTSPLTEHRKARRHTYTCRQLIAPFDGTRMPEQEEFSWAMFRDVSPTGISFLAKRRPAAKQLVVAVGPAPFSFLVVEVVRIKRRGDFPGHPFHVGCTIVRELAE